jgi:hypothetical protein
MTENAGKIIENCPFLYVFKGLIREKFASFSTLAGLTIAGVIILKHCNS